MEKTHLATEKNLHLKFDKRGRGGEGPNKLSQNS